MSNVSCFPFIRRLRQLLRPLCHGECIYTSVHYVFVSHSVLFFVPSVTTQADVASWAGESWIMAMVGSCLFPCCTTTWYVKKSLTLQSAKARSSPLFPHQHAQCPWHRPQEAEHLW